MPEGWEWCRLKSLAAPHENSFVDGPFGSNLKTEHYTEKKEVRIIQLNNIGELEWKNNGVKYTTFSHAETLERCKSYPGDIVIAKMMPAGRAVIIPDINDIYVISSDCVRLQLPPYIDSNYIMYMINSTTINSSILETVQGIGRSRTSLSKLKEILVPLPGYIEQQKITEKIINLLIDVAVIDDNITDILDFVRMTKNKILDLAIRGKLVAQDPDDEPASVLLERIRAEKEELIKQGKIKRNKKESFIFRGDDNSYYRQTGNLIEPISDWELDDIPDSWALCCLGELCDYGNCNNVEADSITNNAWILDLEDIEKDTGRVIKKIRKTERDFTSTKHTFHEGQVLYSKLRPYLNKVIIADEDGFCTSEILPLDFSKVVLPQYALYYLMSPTFLKYANRCSYGVKMPRLGTADGKKAIFPLPPLEEQYRISDCISKIFMQVDTISASIL